MGTMLGLVADVDGYEMVLVPAGKAIFGSEGDGSDSEYDGRPRFEAHLAGYYLGRYCVTNAQYLAFVEATGHPPPDQVDRHGGRPAVRAALLSGDGRNAMPGLGDRISLRRQPTCRTGGSTRRSRAASGARCLGTAAVTMAGPTSSKSMTSS
jgi:formylglycine-generating enzyme required for sulfatase activity